jgi:predicted MPP superfamily phosphohydrolase
MPLHIERVEFFHPDLPTGNDGLRALFVSDMHLGRKGRLGPAEKALVKWLASENSDLVLFGGDYQEGHGSISEEQWAGVETILRAARARFGVFGCIGNHDKPRAVKLLRELSKRSDVAFQIALNEAFHVHEGLYVSVTGDAWDGHDDVPLSMKGIPPGAFTLMLSHSPDVAWRASAAGVSVCLCGHTHGGQVRLPIVGAPMKRIRGDRRLYIGDFRLNRMLLHVTSGFGTSLLPIRIGTKRSVTELVLRHGPLSKNSARRVFRRARQTDTAIPVIR